MRNLSYKFQNEKSQQSHLKNHLKDLEGPQTSHLIEVIKEEY